MEFIGRQDELELLEDQYRLAHPFVIVSGRRRVGKSTLIMRFLEGKEHLYYETAEASKQMLLPDFSKKVGEAIGTPGISCQDWETAMRLYIDSSPGRKVIVIDEFQYMITADSGILRRFQSLWDTFLSKRNVMLILCGSYLTMMGRLGSDYNSPLYGRNTADLRLHPLGFDICRGMSNYRSAVESYAVTGGVPYYMELMDPSLTAVENAKRLMMGLGAPLLNEPGYLFSGEFRSLGNYNTYLRVLSEGNRKMEDIADKAHAEQSAVSPYLNKLTEIDVVVREIPVTSKPGSKTGLYRISDNLISLWFRFVYPEYHDIMRGRADHAKAELDDHFVDRHVARVFEDISLDELMRSLRSIGVAAKYGRYWDRNDEIDVAALDTRNGIIYAGECKFWNRPVDGHTVMRHISKCDSIDAFKGMWVVPCMFSVSGYTEDAIRIAVEEDAVLFDCGMPLPETKAGILHLETGARGRAP